MDDKSGDTAHMTQTTLQVSFHTWADFHLQTCWDGLQRLGREPAFMKPACAETTPVTLAWGHRETAGPRSDLPGLAADLRDCFPGSISEFSRYGRSHLCQDTAVPRLLHGRSTPCRGSWVPGLFLTGL